MVNKMNYITQIKVSIYAHWKEKKLLRRYADGDIVIAVFSVRLSVRLSVHLSITLRYCVQTAKRITIEIIYQNDLL